MKQPHILCEPKDISEYVILPGDPGRVLRVGALLDSYEEVAYNREFRTIKGYYKGVPITVTSTGIGGPSASIAIEELISCGAKYLIRIGSGGAVQSNIDIGDLIVCSAATREEGTTSMYITPTYPAVPDIKLTNLIIDTCEELKYKYHYGIVRSHDSFYTDNEDKIMEYWNSKNILASDMETSSLFVIGQLRGVKTASILNNVVKYDSGLKESIGDYVMEGIGSVEGEKRQIILALETFAKLNK
ncbi:nucleoside phosphorylase [Tissierella sp. MB52-C2]|uniref:nucleoside phosphorylase n=1 Tax=Tissierella sp. MB52-C2 TaxID=3070999 RepID=UPI00280B35CA|nr:nucleoside phosphorylase [Tissierella sp. MB52-C2]WMM25388.1 nucleoside phosphorylase [Tissierella sp. MB52-C2]